MRARQLLASVYMAAAAVGAAPSVACRFDSSLDLKDWRFELGKWAVVDGGLLQSEAWHNYAIAWLPNKAYSDLDMSVEFFVHPAKRGVKAPGLVYHATGMKTLYYIHFDVHNANIL